jgi:hypothetical protein
MMKKIPWLAAFSTLLFFGVIVLYALEVGWIHRTLQGNLLVRYGALVGLLLGLPIGAIMAWKAKYAADRAPFFFAGLLGCLVLGPLSGSLSNRLPAADQPIVNTTVEVHLEEAYYSLRFGKIKGARPKPDGYRAYFYYQDQLTKVQVTEPLFPGKRRGDEAILPLKTGFWGFEFVPKPTP